MNQAGRRQLPITICSARAAALPLRLATGGSSPAEIIEEAFERLASQRKTLFRALAPAVSQDVDWESAPSTLASRAPDLDDKKLRMLLLP